jgi:hypothetical protein
MFSTIGAVGAGVVSFGAQVPSPSALGVFVSACCLAETTSVELSLILGIFTVGVLLGAHSV